MVKKIIRIFPYAFQIEESFGKPEIFVKTFNPKNIKKLLMKHGDCNLSLIIDEEVGNFVCGRFLKLRKDVPSIISIANGSERLINLLDDENILEISHFLMNFEDKIILAEYNHYAVRHFTNPLEKYLDFIFRKNNASINPIPDSDTFKSMQTEKAFKSLKIRLAQSSLKRKEKEIGVSILGQLKELALGGQTIIDIKISRGRGIDTDINKKKLIDYANNLKDSDDIKILKIESKNAEYDILNNNLLSYSCSVNKKNNKIDKFSFFQETQKLYLDRINYIKSCLKS